jgi:hypothetical protein
MAGPAIPGRWKRCPAIAALLAWRLAPCAPLHRASEAARSENLLLICCKSPGGSRNASPHRHKFIERNHGVRCAQTNHHNLSARDLVLILCRCSDTQADDPTAR